MAFAAIVGSPATVQASDCTWRNSARATISEIASKSQRFQGRCVIVDGMMRGDSLFASVDGVYVRPPNGLNPSSSGLRIGLDNMAGLGNDGDRPVSVLGRVQDCETTRAVAHANDREDEIAMIAGYCHTYDGGYLWVSDLRRRRGAPFTRQLGFRSREDYGDLEPAPADWPHRARIEELADQFLAALRGGDHQAMAAMHFRDVGLQWPEEEAALLRFLFEDAKSPFASLRRATTAPGRILLVDRSNLRSGADPREAGDYTATVCFCRLGRCNGLWPIASFDADNLPARPYACTTIGPYFDRDREIPHFRTDIGKYGLREPPGNGPG